MSADFSLGDCAEPIRLTDPGVLDTDYLRLPKAVMKASGDIFDNGKFIDNIGSYIK